MTPFNTRYQRRNFIKHAIMATLSIQAIPVLGIGLKKTLAELPDKKPPLPPEMVSEFVRVAHFDLKAVKEMFDKEPMLVNASWDWGGGDFEAALGGPAHIGNRDIVNYLLDNGARQDIFSSAMLGEKKLVHAFLKTNPGIVNVRGPHRFSLLYHVAISGKTEIADLLKPHLTHLAEDSNQALHAAARGGALPMTEWLLNNGVTDPNTTDFAGNTPAMTADKKGFSQLVMLLKKHGGKI